MRMRPFQLACLLGLILVLFSTQTAHAHEHITIGDYELVIGWLEEPPIAGQKNAIVISITEQGSGAGLAEEDAASLEITVSYGGQSKVLTLEPLSNDSPGEFMTPLLPTVPGEYTVILGGQLGDTTVEAEVHVEEVQPAEVLQFPILESSPQMTNVGIGDWLTWLAVLLGLAGVVLGIMAHRKAG